MSTTPSTTDELPVPNPAPKPSPRFRDPETDSIKECVRVLEDMPQASRVRIATYLFDRYRYEPFVGSLMAEPGSPPKDNKPTDDYDI